jgi:Pentapeptide repeats (8 copies)
MMDETPLNYSRHARKEGWASLCWRFFSTALLTVLLWIVGYGFQGLLNILYAIKIRPIGGPERGSALSSKQATSSPTRMIFAFLREILGHDFASRRTKFFLALMGSPLFLAIILIFWVLPTQHLASEKIASDKAELSKKEFYELQNGIRQTTAQALGGAILLLGLYFTAKTLRTSQEGQITDRFTKAINQLGETGPEKLAIRLGGIYALERIARDSERDHWPIMEVLTAYVRENASCMVEGERSQEEISPSELPLTWTAMPLKAHGRLMVRKGEPRPKLSADIQAVLTVLGRRPRTHRRGDDQRLNLSRTNLRGAELRGAQLQRADLAGAQLQGVYLNDAQLQGVILLDTQLARANLAGAKLTGTRYLTIEQLSTVKTLYKAILDAPLREQIEQRYPHLLEEPQD